MSAGRRLNTVTTLLLPRLTYSLKVPAGFFVETNKLTLDFMWKGKGMGQPNQFFEGRLKLEESQHVTLYLLFPYRSHTTCGWRGRGPQIGAAGGHRGLTVFFSAHGGGTVHWHRMNLSKISHFHRQIQNGSRLRM